jgi:hypothetical protein
VHYAAAQAAARTAAAPSPTVRFEGSCVYQGKYPMKLDRKHISRESETRGTSRAQQREAILRLSCFEWYRLSKFGQKTKIGRFVAYLRTAGDRCRLCRRRSTTWGVHQSNELAVPSRDKTRWKPGLECSPMSAECSATTGAGPAHVCQVFQPFACPQPKSPDRKI